MILVMAGLVGSGEVIRACVTTATGAVRIVSTDSACEEGESVLEWGVVGMQGPLPLSLVPVALLPSAYGVNEVRSHDVTAPTIVSIVGSTWWHNACWRRPALFLYART
jgi:hypothetical protein